MASRTKPGTQKLSEVTRHLSLPTGIASTGWPSIARTCQVKLGVEFDEWQHGAGRVMLAKRANGKLAATISGVGMSLPRQIGKTYLMAGVLFALCVEKPGLLAIWSAHHSRTHAETFLSMQGFAERAKVKPHIRNVYTGSGDEEVRFLNGSRILFGARERGFGRGIPGVDVLVFDEAQILSDRALSNMVATMNTSQFGMHLYIGTPPRPTDESESFVRMRTQALLGKLPDGAWIECGAEPGCDPDDRTQWARANPSHPHRTPVEAFLRLREKLTEEDYLREALGVWDAKVTHGVIPMTLWDEAADELSMPADRFALGVEVGPDGAYASVSLAGLREDGRWHVELDESKKGSSWVVPYVANLIQRNPQIRAVAVDEGSPTKAIVDDLVKAKVRTTAPTVRELGAAHMKMLDGIVTGSVAHTGQHQMDGAVAIATKRPLGDTGMWVFHRSSSAADITPIQSATLALWGAQHTQVKRPDRTNKRRVVVR